jgi:hypothetical protein
MKTARQSAKEAFFPKCNSNYRAPKHADFKEFLGMLASLLVRGKR